MVGGADAEAVSELFGGEPVVVIGGRGILLGFEEAFEILLLGGGGLEEEQDVVKVEGGGGESLIVAGLGLPGDVVFYGARLGAVDGCCDAVGRGRGCDG